MASSNLFNPQGVWRERCQIESEIQFAQRNLDRATHQAKCARKNNGIIARQQEKEKNLRVIKRHLDLVSTEKSSKTSKNRRNLELVPRPHAKKHREQNEAMQAFQFVSVCALAVTGAMAHCDIDTKSSDEVTVYFRRNNALLKVNVARIVNLDNLKKQLSKKLNLPIPGYGHMTRNDSYLKDNDILRNGDKLAFTCHGRGGGQGDAHLHQSSEVAVIAIEAHKQQKDGFFFYGKTGDQKEEKLSYDYKWSSEMMRTYLKSFPSIEKIKEFCKAFFIEDHGFSEEAIKLATVLRIDGHKKSKKQWIECAVEAWSRQELVFDVNRYQLPPIKVTTKNAKGEREPNDLYIKKGPGPNGEKTVYVVLWNGKEYEGLGDRCYLDLESSKLIATDPEEKDEEIKYELPDGGSIAAIIDAKASVSSSSSSSSHTTVQSESGESKSKKSEQPEEPKLKLVRGVFKQTADYREFLSPTGVAYIGNGKFICRYRRNGGVYIQRFTETDFTKPDFRARFDKESVAKIQKEIDNPTKLEQPPAATANKPPVIDLCGSDIEEPPQKRPAPAGIEPSTVLVETSTIGKPLASPDPKEDSDANSQATRSGSVTPTISPSDLNPGGFIDDEGGRPESEMLVMPHGSPDQAIQGYVNLEQMQDHQKLLNKDGTDEEGLPLVDVCMLPNGSCAAIYMYNREKYTVIIPDTDNNKKRKEYFRCFEEKFVFFCLNKIAASRQDADALNNFWWYWCPRELEAIFTDHNDFWRVYNSNADIAETELHVKLMSDTKYEHLTIGYIVWTCNVQSFSTLKDYLAARFDNDSDEQKKAIEDYVALVSDIWGGDIAKALRDGTLAPRQPRIQLQQIRSAVKEGDCSSQKRPREVNPNNFEPDPNSRPSSPLQTFQSRPASPEFDLMWRQGSPSASSGRSLSAQPGIHKVNNEPVPSPHGSPITPPQLPDETFDCMFGNAVKVADAGHLGMREVLNNASRAAGNGSIYSTCTRTFDFGVPSDDWHLRNKRNREEVQQCGKDLEEINRLQRLVHEHYTTVLHRFQNEKMHQLNNAISIRIEVESQQNSDRTSCGFAQWVSFTKMQMAKRTALSNAITLGLSQQNSEMTSFGFAEWASFTKRMQVARRLANKRRQEAEEAERQAKRLRQEADEALRNLNELTNL